MEVGMQEGSEVLVVKCEVVDNDGPNAPPNKRDLIFTYIVATSALADKLQIRKHKWPDVGV